VSHSSPIGRSARAASFASIVTILIDSIASRVPAANATRSFDRHGVVDGGIGMLGQRDDRARSLPRRHQPVFAQPPGALSRTV